MYRLFPGPSDLPWEVQETIAKDILQSRDLEESYFSPYHRSDAFQALLQRIHQRLIKLLEIPDDFDILWFEGGASLQFHMIPLNLSFLEKNFGYAVTGVWAKKAYEESFALFPEKTQIVFDGESTHFSQLPLAFEQNDLAYIHLCENNTVYGSQYITLPETSIPLVIDITSSILLQPVDWTRVSLAYASCQKNLGLAGLTCVIIKKDWIHPISIRPLSLSYQEAKNKGSLIHTPPVFHFRVLDTLLTWAEQKGGVKFFQKQSQALSNLVYRFCDAYPHLFHNGIEPAFRSFVNPTFTLPSLELTTQFLAEARKRKIIGIEGYRTVGGIRFSFYLGVDPSVSDALEDLFSSFSSSI